MTKERFYSIRRINNEIKKFWLIDEDYIDPLVEFNNRIRHIGIIDDVIYFMLIKNRNNIINQIDDGNIVVAFEMKKSNYPFGPPKKTLINGRNYFNYLKYSGPNYKILETLIEYMITFQII